MRPPAIGSDIVPQVPSRTNVTFTVARNSAIFPPSTAAFSFTISIPVIPRSVRFARSSALRTASSQLCGEAPMICVTRATAMCSLSSLEQERDPHVDPILDDEPPLDLHALSGDLEARDPAQGARGAREP